MGGAKKSASSLVSAAEISPSRLCAKIGGRSERRRFLPRFDISQSHASLSFQTA